MNWEAPTLRETARFAVRSGRSGAFKRLPLLFYVFFSYCCWGRRKLAEALAMTERVSEIVRAMEPRFAQLIPSFFPALLSSRLCRFGAIDRELSQHAPQPPAAVMSPAISWTGNQLQGATSPETGDDFFVA
jgi:hypothetical protein